MFFPLLTIRIQICLDECVQVVHAEWSPVASHIDADHTHTIHIGMQVEDPVVGGWGWGAVDQGGIGRRVRADPLVPADMVAAGSTLDVALVILCFCVADESTVVVRRRIDPDNALRHGGHVAGLVGGAVISGIEPRNVKSGESLKKRWPRRRVMV